ncbi:putative RepA leader peptide Tap [Ancylostoma ceylanicum]|uniref:Putative RepA leader peptide Tap n=1 Tax=Ancylostoma ceylanicum TaxID=53326 RepID=A0A0D6LW60_9BILA|nr:putative RepA leader peptide Tap [Ancylostoma ceylanicum]
MDNFQAIVSQFFETTKVFGMMQGDALAPWIHEIKFLFTVKRLLLCSVVAAATDFKLNTTNETLQVFLPDKMESLSDFKKLVALFPPQDAQRDTYSVFGSKFASVIFEDVDGNAATPQAIKRLAKLHRSIVTLKWDKLEQLLKRDQLKNVNHENVISTSDNLSLSTVCLRQSDNCALHPLAYALEDEEPVLSVQFLLRYPMLKLGDLAIDNALVFGDVKVNESKKDEDGNAPVETARAIRVFYMLEASEDADRWIRLFLKHMAAYSEESSRIFWTSSRSLADEMERNGALLIPWMPWAALALVVFCMAVCSSRDVVRSQPFIGFFAMFNAAMATVASMALLLYVRYPFLPLVFIMPFLVVSIGTDNMFLMLKSWRLSPEADVERRFVDALTETAASLFLTSLTDGLSFSVGSVSDFYAVRVFCTYCAMAILFMFIFQVTFFNAVMVLCCRRELAGRHSLLCYKVSKKEIVRDAVTLHHSTNGTCGAVLAEILSTTGAKVVTVLVYLVYLAASINYALGKFNLSWKAPERPTSSVSALPLGLDLKLLAPLGSYAAEELRAQERLFFDYGPYCFAVVLLRNRSLTNPEERRRLLLLYNALSRFDLNGDIEATKMLLRVRLLGPAHDKPRAEFLRSTMRDGGFDGFAYDTSFLLVDQQLATASGVITNVITATVTMLFICVLMVPRPVSATCIAVSILSINLGVVGALSSVDTRLDIISMITIVMSIGFSVDYVTHTTFHFIIQKDNRLKKCLTVMTEPILQSALSTVVGVSLLAFVPSYIVRTFVWTVFAVVGIGLLHGLLFVPVLLELMVPPTEYMQPYNAGTH